MNKSKLTTIWSSPSFRNVGKLLSANVIAQAIGLLIYPILTRMYAPEDFGLLNLFTSIGGILIILSTLEWHKAIVLPQKEDDAKAVVHITFISICAITLLIAVTLPFAGPIAGIFKSPHLAEYYWLLPVYVFLSGAWNMLNYWYIRQKAYTRISGYQISQSFFSTGYKTGFGLLDTLQGGLIYSSILSPLCSLLLSISLAAKKQLCLWDPWNGDTCRQMAIQYANFPKFSLPHSLINNIAGQLPVLLLTPFFGPKLVGFWGVALLLSFSPISMITNALHQVMYQKTIEQVRAHQSIAHFYRRFTIWSIILIVPFFTCLWFVLPLLTQWLLGDEWSVTGEYIQWLLPWLLCMFLCASTGYLLDIFSKQKQGLYFEIIIAIARLMGLGIGIYLHSFVMAIACYAIASAVINGVQYVWLMCLVKKYEGSLKRSE